MTLQRHQFFFIPFIPKCIRTYSSLPFLLPVSPAHTGCVLFGFFFGLLAFGPLFLHAEPSRPFHQSSRDPSTLRKPAFQTWRICRAKEHLRRMATCSDFGSRFLNWFFGRRIAMPLRGRPSNDWRLRRCRPSTSDFGTQHLAYYYIPPWIGPTLRTNILQVRTIS